MSRYRRLNDAFAALVARNPVAGFFAGYVMCFAFVLMLRAAWPGHQSGDPFVAALGPAIGTTFGIWLHRNHTPEQRKQAQRRGLWLLAAGMAIFLLVALVWALR